MEQKTVSCNKYFIRLFFFIYVGFIAVSVAFQFQAVFLAVLTTAYAVFASNCQLIHLKQR